MALVIPDQPKFWVVEHLGVNGVMDAFGIGAVFTKQEDADEYSKAISEKPEMQGVTYIHQLTQQEIAIALLRSYVGNLFPNHPGDRILIQHLR